MLKEIVIKIYIGYKKTVNYIINPVYFKFVSQLKNIEILKLKNNINNLIIVAHPDDEMIFFNKFLLENKNTLVICLTSGGSRKRSKEFYKSLEYYKTKGLIYNFKDGLDVEWQIDKVLGVLRKILQLTKPQKILSHNKEGEYGHPQHINCNKIIEDLLKEEFTNIEFLIPEVNSKLFIEDNKLSTKKLNKKIKVFKDIYKSQSKGILNRELVYYKYMEFEKIVIHQTN